VASLRWASHEDPEKRRLGRLAEKAKLLDPEMERNFGFENWSRSIIG
jgi:hypothetical protein